MAEPVSPIPTSQLHSKNKEGSKIPPPPTPSSRPPQSLHIGRESTFNDDDDCNLGLERQSENYRDYYEEDLMVELLERRRRMFAKSNSLHPSTVRVSHVPSLLSTDANSGSASGEARSAYRYRDRDSGKTAAAHDERSVSRISYDNKSKSNTKVITRWTLAGVEFLLVVVIVPCIARDTFGTLGSATSGSLLSFCNKLTLPRWPPVVGVVDTEEGRGQGVEKGEGSWRTSLRTCWTRSQIFPIFKSPIALPRSAIDILSSHLSTDELTNGGDESPLEGLAHRMTGVVQSLSSMKVDLQLIQEHLRSSQWVENKVLHLIRGELPAELLLVKDSTTGKMEVPVEFWEGARDLLVAKGYLSVASKDGLSRQRDGKWEDFLLENENRVRILFLDKINNKSSQRAVLSREEFLYLVATESKAIWKNLEGWIDSFMQRQLDQWKPEVVLQSGDNRRRLLSHAEQHVLSEMIDRAVERHHHQHCYHEPLPSNNVRSISEQPDYALYNSGGRIVPYLTTPDYHRYKPSAILGRFFRLQNWISPPAVSGYERLAIRAIQADMQAGDCWPMQGGQGQIAIRLARRIVVTAVTIEHVDPKLSLDTGSAPREIEVWRLVAPRSSSTFSFDLSASRTQGSKQGDKGKGEDEGEKGNETPILATWHKYGSPSPGASLLTTITYQQLHNKCSGVGDRDRTDTTGGECSGRHIKDSYNKRLLTPGTAQTFLIPLSRQNAPAYGVLVRVLSNWGHPDFTCLYRVRVHGYEV